MSLAPSIRVAFSPDALAPAHDDVVVHRSTGPAQGIPHLVADRADFLIAFFIPGHQGRVQGIVVGARLIQFLLIVRQSG